jgi:ribosomal-protein-alanine N-acetyltransferase
MPDPARIRIESLRAEHARHVSRADRSVSLSLHSDEIPQSIAALAKATRSSSAGPADVGEVWLNWVLRRADSGAYVGTLQATVTPDSHAYIGYVLGRDSWGQGLATEACGWLIDELQERFALKEILATVDVRNVRSVRVLERIGFRCAATEPSELRGERTSDFRYRFACAVAALQQRLPEISHALATDHPWRFGAAPSGGNFPDVVYARSPRCAARAWRFSMLVIWQ